VKHNISTENITSYHRKVIYSMSKIQLEAYQSWIYKK